MFKRLIKRLYSKTFIKVLFIIIILVPLTYTLYATVQTNSLTKLGYTKQEAKAMVNPFSIYNIVSREMDNLEKDIAANSSQLEELGLSEEQVDKIIKDNKTSVKIDKTLSQKKEEREKLIKALIKDYETQAQTYNIKYKYNEKDTIYQQYLYLKKTVTAQLGKIIKDYEKYLYNIGYSEQEIKKYKSNDLDATYKKLKVVYDQEKKNEALFSGFQNAQLKQQALVMFHEINEYRASKGLKPYAYASGKQSCAFKEARAYASNKNPHNWLCSCANENASLASVNADYVSIALHFFKTDPPHERVIGGNYTSVAIAFVQKGDMVYMIVDVW